MRARVLYWEEWVDQETGDTLYWRIRSIDENHDPGDEDRSAP